MIGMLVLAAVVGVYPHVNSVGVRVIDGDTIKVDTLLAGIDQEGKLPASVTIRLRNVDCPESKQPGGPEAAAKLHSLIDGGSTVEVRMMSRDIYGRTLGDIGRDTGEEISDFSDATRWSDFATELVRGGYCMAYRGRGPLARETLYAMKEKTGPLWDGRYDAFCASKAVVAMKNGGFACHPRLAMSYSRYNCSAVDGSKKEALCMLPTTPPWIWRKSKKEIKDLHE